MITPAENERLTRVGRGTPGGELMRRYWHPLAATAELLERPTKPVRLLGESLELGRDRNGDVELRGATGAYPVADRGGLLWAYLGPLPAPVIPPLMGLDDARAVRLLGSAVIPCNWLQIMENSVDAVHTEWLHGHLFEFVLEKQNFKTNFTRKHLKIGFDEFAYGLIKRRVVEGRSEDDDDWKIGHPVVFPTTLLVGSDSESIAHLRYQFRVPMDDTHTLHLWYHVIVPPAHVDAPVALTDRVHTYDVPFLDERGEFILDAIHAQDVMAWVTQGPIVDRSREALVSTDRGITAYRNLLRRELKNVEAGIDPMNVFRPGSAPAVMELPLERRRGQRDADAALGAMKTMFTRHEVRYCPAGPQIVDFFERATAPAAGVA